MLILAFDTSGFAGSVALLEGPQVLEEETLDPARRSAQTLAPAIARLLARRQIAASEIGLVAVTVGPGSFTGLRVGVTTAKTLAYAAGAEVIGLSTLEVLAQQVSRDFVTNEPTSERSEIQAILDAQRKELFLGRFNVSPPQLQAKAGSNDLTRLAPDGIISIAAWLDALSPGTTVTGTGIDKLQGQLPPGIAVMPPALRQPQAATVGRLAWHYYQSGRRDDLWKLSPVYLRPSYAEEKGARK